MNTNKLTIGMDPKGKLSFRTIAIIAGALFIIADIAGFAGAVDHDRDVD